MTDPRTDAIARHAARLVETGKAEGINAAIRIAAQSLGFQDVPLPGALLVRKHAQAMSMQAMGDAAYVERRHRVWEITEQVMSVFEHAMPEARMFLVGRAADGHIDAGVTIHLRIYTPSSVTEIARCLVEYGYEEPEFRTVESLNGRLNQLRFSDEGVGIALTRCPPAMFNDHARDLFRGEPVATLDLDGLRKQLARA